MFCFAIFGAIVFPPRLSRLCGYVIAVAVLALCIQVVLDEFDGASLDYLFGIGHIFLTFGIPALVFLARHKAPFEFGAKDIPASSYEEDD